MARPLRTDIPNGVYHLTSRGLDRQAIVGDDGDREKWTELLRRESRRNRARLATQFCGVAFPIDIHVSPRLCPKHLTTRDGPARHGQRGVAGALEFEPQNPAGPVLLSAPGVAPVSEHHGPES